MAPPATDLHRDVRLERLRAFQDALVGALGELGVGGTRLSEILGKGVTAACAQCGFELTGDDLAAAFAAEAAHATANPKHARLLQHYCARSGCNSYFYRFEFRSISSLEWPGVLARAEARLAAAEQLALEEAEEKRQAARVLVRRRARLGVSLAVAVGALWIAKRWWDTGALPGATSPPKYQVDPASLGSLPGAR